MTEPRGKAEVFAGRYELLEEIGDGGMGTVWRAYDRRRDVEIAAKVLRQHDAESLLRFVREQGLRVEHPHVLAPDGWAAEDGMVLLTMPLVRGGSLATLVQDHGALPAPFAVELLRQILLGLAEVHGSGVVHRDVKPGNVLLAATGTGRPHAYLGDFGIAVQEDGPRLTQTGGFIGTPGYMAPEQAVGAEPHPTADLYSVGKLAQLLLTGQRPRTSAEGTAHPGVPEALWRWVIVMTAAEPFARPQSVAEAVAGLEATGVAWTEGAAGDIDVLTQIGASEPVAAAPDDDLTTRVAATGTTSRPLSSRALAGVLAAVSLASLLALLLVWSPWSGEPSDSDTTPPATTSTSRTTPATSTMTSPPATSTSGKTSRSPTSPTSGRVRVGTVVTRVGQRCGASELGATDTTISGVPVVCERNADGQAVWAADE